MSGTIVQYILIRGDLLLKEAWPMGAVLAQACHAATAAIHLFHRNKNHRNKIYKLDSQKLGIAQVHVF